MNKNAGLLLLLFVVNFLYATGLSQEKAGGKELTVQVRVLKADLTGHKLRLSWKIANESAKAVYVYATFLHGPPAGYETSDKGVLVVNTSMMRKSPVGVNFYPKAEFLELAPGRSLKGSLRDAALPDSILKPLPKAVMLNIAYGEDIAQVKEQLRVTRSTDQHPANPIVEWQILAHSEMFALR
jgi:hypothetical protein